MKRNMPAIPFLAILFCSILFHGVCASASDDHLSSSPELSTSNSSDGIRTVIYLYRKTKVGEEVFLRGGHDANLVDQGHFPSSSEDIRFLNTLNPSNSALKAKDLALDWHTNSAMDWTTNQWHPAWGTAKHYEQTGYGEDPENQWGDHWWKFEVTMDGHVGDWFEFKALLRDSDGEHWEANIDQDGAPFDSHNHWARKGYITRVAYESNSAEYIPLHTISDVKPVSFTPAIAVPGSNLTITYQGEFRNADGLILRYGYDGWNHISDQGLRHDRDSGNDNYYKEVAMDKMSNGGFFVTISVPHKARAVHFAFRADENGVEQWDNNDRKDYRKAVVFPYLGPYLTWNDTARPHNGIVVNFQTSNPTLANVEYGTTESLGNKVTAREATDIHHFELTGLSAKTTYFYRVNDDLGQSSPISSFTTGSESDRDFKFLVMADMQDNGDDRRWRDIAQEVRESHSDARFILIAGDMPWDDEPGHWWTFFDKGRELFAGVAVMPVLGNHDTPSVRSHPDSSSYRAYFDLPAGSGTEEYYTFDFGNTRFFNLNSERPSQFNSTGGAQYDWIKQEIADIGAAGAKQYDWIFAQWHIPPYDAADRHWSQQGDYRDITELFDGTVDWVFNGHEHLNHRIKPMEYNGTLSSRGYDHSGNTGYLIVPPAGNHPANELISPNHPKAHYRDRVAFPSFGSSDTTVESEIGFVTVEIDGTSIDLKTYGMGTLEESVASHVRDQVTYSK